MPLPSLTPKLTYTAYDVYGVAYQKYYLFDQLVNIFSSTIAIDLVASVDLQQSSDVRLAIKTVLMARPSLISTNSWINLVNKLKVLSPPFAGQGRYYCLNTFFANSSAILNFVDSSVVQAIPAAVFNAIFQMQGVPFKIGVYNKMSDEQIGQLSTDIIRSLNLANARRSSSNLNGFISVLTFTQLNSLTSSQLTDLLTTIEAFELSTAQILNGFNSAQFAGLSTFQLANILSPDNIFFQAMPPEWKFSIISTMMRGLTPAQFAEFSPEIFAQFTAAEISQIPTSVLHVLSPIVFAKFSPAQTHGLTSEQIQLFTKDEIARLPVSVISQFFRQQIYAISAQGISGLTDDQLNILTQDQIYNSPSSVYRYVVALTNNGEQYVPALVTGMRKYNGGINKNNAAGLTAHQISVLGDRISWLGPEAISALSLDAIHALTARQLSLLNVSQIQGVTQTYTIWHSRHTFSYHGIFLVPAGIASYNDDVYNTSETITKGFTPTQIAALATEQLNAFTPVQLSAFTNAQVLALTSDQKSHLTPDQIAIFNIITPGFMGEVSKSTALAVTTQAIIQPADAIIQTGVATSSHANLQVLDLTPPLMDIAENLIQVACTFDVGLGLTTDSVTINLNPNLNQGLSFYVTQSNTFHAG